MRTHFYKQSPESARFVSLYQISVSCKILKKKIKQKWDIVLR
jgi:hypothetical protein